MAHPVDCTCMTCARRAAHLADHARSQSLKLLNQLGELRVAFRKIQGLCDDACAAIEEEIGPEGTAKADWERQRRNSRHMAFLGSKGGRQRSENAKHARAAKTPAPEPKP